MSINTMKFPTALKNKRIPELLSVYRAGADKLSYLVNGLPAEILQARPIENKWSIQELVFHLLDSELVGLVRMRMVIAEPGKSLPFYEQNDWAERLHYNSRTTDEVFETIRSFYILRDNHALLLESLPDAIWKREGLHQEYGLVTLKNLLELYADHSERHLEQIMERMKLLGYDKEVKIDLTERLY